MASCQHNVRRVAPTCCDSYLAIPYLPCAAPSCELLDMKDIDMSDVNAHLGAMPPLESSPHAGKRLRIVLPISGGFFVRPLHVISLGAWAARQRMHFVVVGNETQDPYQGSEEQSW